MSTKPQVPLSRFELYYFQEVQADLYYRYRPEYDEYRITAIHPIKSVPIDDWFHFTEDKPSIGRILSFHSDGAIEAVALMADKLAPGPAAVLNQAGVEDTRRQFFTDFMAALAIGEYDINDGRPVKYEHPAGDWLMEQTERFK